MAMEGLAGGTMVESLTQALQSARLFQKQTAERVSSMKLEVLHAYENDAGGQDSQYKRDVTAKIVSLVEARSASVEEFRRSQEGAEKLMASLKGNPDGPAANEDREQVVEHFKAIEVTRKEQLEAERQLEKLLELKEKVKQQDGFALRISHESIMMAPKQDALTELNQQRAANPPPILRAAGPLGPLLSSRASPLLSTTNGSTATAHGQDPASTSEWLESFVGGVPPREESLRLRAVSSS
eukprot:CAMPEP_0180387960 /NCGR_PEP_ID=MMETSP0989-20121125/30544_1 /TAXON_ID=697907 /ORGANISM="non described non described, Strain CCMP2293" /LENGTH=239 /DNA_ID=CAMNT_0022388911 /DNA_START=93 /DNA_END=809 /DNA_ORIENTATION=-